jgi:2-iminobutanoate/2-iminopropanoate deaminase
MSLGAAALIHTRSEFSQLICSAARVKIRRAPSAHRPVAAIDLMARQVVQCSHAPQAIGPYSQAIRSGQLLFVSGQIPLDPDTGELVGGGIEDQTRRVMQNVQAILEAAGASLGHVVKTTIFLVDLADFPAANEVYSGYFVDSLPARATVQVAALPRQARVEIEVIASFDE